MSYRRSYYCLQAEMLLSRMVIAMPVMTVFYYSIGMNQALIGLSQSCFTIAVLMTDLPTGWLADRFSRRWAGVFGDAMLTVGFLTYAFAPGFWWVVGCEIIIGIGMAFTNGCDLPLLASYCQELGEDFASVYARVTALMPLTMATGMIMGGLVGASHARWAVLATAVPFAVSTIMMLLTVDAGERRQPNGKHPLRDMYEIAVLTLHGQRDLAWASLAAASQREVTHAVVWALTPLLLRAGLPLWMVPCFWATNMLAGSLGSLAAKRFAPIISDARAYSVAMGMALCSCLVLAVGATIWTAWLYLVLGAVLGWTSVTSGLLIQHRAPKDIQTTVHSVTSSLGRVLYAGLVIIVNAMANAQPTRAFLANGLVFLPIGWLVYRGLKRQLG